jgi:hypothetical protein
VQGKFKFVCNQKEVIPPLGETTRIELSELVEVSYKPWLYLSGVGFPGLVVKDSLGFYIWVGQEDCYWASVKSENG